MPRPLFIVLLMMYKEFLETIKFLKAKKLGPRELKTSQLVYLCTYICIIVYYNPLATITT